MSASAVPVSPFRGYRFPPEIISHAVWLYHRFSVSHRDIEELLAERGVQVSRVGGGCGARSATSARPSADGRDVVKPVSCFVPA